MKEPAKFFQELIRNVLMPDGSNPEVMQYYTNDFLRMTFPGQALSVYEVNGVWWNTRFKWHWLEPQAYRYLWLQELGEKRVAYQVLHTSQQLLVISLNSTLTKVGFFLMESLAGLLQKC